ncbi:hypothetical protein [Cupriavidus lacunae]|uniref:hypothetical protein n=1 Tax=Cupriavidus lacunae TaxID=2666307 RepID=UPI001374E7AC|nr:hypothetical protein [Cupriavidus lacunae]
MDLQMFAKRALVLDAVRGGQGLYKAGISTVLLAEERRSVSLRLWHNTGID